MWVGFRFLDTEVDCSNPGSISMLCPSTESSNMARDTFHPLHVAFICLCPNDNDYLAWHTKFPSHCYEGWQWTDVPLAIGVLLAHADVKQLCDLIF